MGWVYIQTLLDAGAKEIPFSDGNTALHTVYNQLSHFRTLVEAGWDMHVRNEGGYSPLDMAAIAYAGTHSKDPWSSLLGRSILVLGATPLFLVRVVLRNLIGSVTDVAQRTFSILKKVCQEGVKKSFYATVELPKLFASRVWRVIKAPFYAVRMLGAALIAPIAEDIGREQLFKAEMSWNEGKIFLS